MKAIKACTLGPKHGWAFVRNVQVGSVTVGRQGSVGRFSLKGLYRCECGAVKHGAYNPNGADLRQLVPQALKGGAA